MKKRLAFLLALTLAVGLLGGCSLGKEPAPESSGPLPESSEVPEKPYQIGLIQYSESQAPDAIREAFMNRLEEWGYGDEKVQIDYQNAQGDPGKAADICEKFVEDQTDIIVAISSPAAQAAVKAAEGSDVKVLFAGAEDLAELGVKNQESPEGNVTGAGSGVSAAAMVDLALQADPELKTAGLLYRADQEDSKAAAARLKEYCMEKGLAVEEAAMTSESEVQKSAKALCEKADALFTPESGLFTTGAAAAEAARSAKIPWYTAVESLVQEGALASVTPDYAGMGGKAADMAAQIIAGKEISQMAVSVFSVGQVTVNQATLNALEVKIPEEVLETAAFFQ